MSFICWIIDCTNTKWCSTCGKDVGLIEHVLFRCIAMSKARVLSSRGWSWEIQVFNKNWNILVLCLKYWVPYVSYTKLLVVIRAFCCHPPCTPSEPALWVSLDGGFCFSIPFPGSISILKWTISLRTGYSSSGAASSLNVMACIAWFIWCTCN